MSESTAAAECLHKSVPMTETRAKRIIWRLIQRKIMPARLEKDAKRRSIVRELIETERNYVDSLVICEEVYYKPLDRSISSKNPLIDTSTLSRLFGNIDQIREAHQVILRAMDEVVPALRQSFPSHEAFLKIGTGFTEMIPRMQQLYPIYLSSSNSTEEILKKLNKNKKFRNFLSESLFNPRTKCQEIEDLLILPTQRIAGYKLLFERVLRYFPEETHGAEKKMFHTILESLLQIGSAMNAERQDTSSQEKLLNIAESVSKIPGFMVIMKPGRRYFGNVTMHMVDEVTGKKGKKHNIYVTSDLLIICRKYDTGKLVWIDGVPLTQVRFSPFESDTLDKFLDKGFALKTDTKTYNFITKTPKARDQFIDEVKKMKAKIREQVIKQTEEGADYMHSLVAKITELYQNPSPPRTREQAIESLS